MARLWVGALDDADTTVISDPQGAGGNPNLAEYRYVPHIVLGLLVVLYGVRSFYRNFDWHTDVTLWAAAKTESPISFRSYQSYAFALFEQDAAGNCDRMIQTDEDGLKIVDDLPNPLNSSRLYLHLGMYYGLKGELLSKPVTNSIEVTEAAVPWFQKSAGILERGVPVDRAFNEVNRGRDVKRGRNGEDTPDVGLAPVYGYLGVAYLRVNRLDEAEQAFRYMRHLECTDPDAYLKLASVYERRNQFDKEAVCLMQVILLDKDNQHPEAWPALNEVFKRINTEPYPCIIQNAAGRAQLDLSRTAVRDTVLDAYRDFVRVFQQAKRKPLAEGARHSRQAIRILEGSALRSALRSDLSEAIPYTGSARPGLLEAAESQIRADDARSSEGGPQPDQQHRTRVAPDGDVERPGHLYARPAEAHSRQRRGRRTARVNELTGCPMMGQWTSICWF